jgi:hypothetical protein
MRNVTITLEEETADWARVWSASHQTSVSRMLGELLSEKMRAEEQYSLAMESYLSVPPMPMAQEPYPSRNAVHER